MRKLIYTCLLMSVCGFSQSTDKNYVKIINFSNPYTTSSNSPQNIPDVLDAKTNIFYLDGFGRIKQEVYFKASNTNKDIVILYEYDEFGRPFRNFLPYVSAAQDGNFKSSALEEILGFYDSGDPLVTGNPNFETTANYFIEKIYDDPIHSRPVIQSAPGDDWQIDSGHEVKNQYYTNENITEVKRFDVSTTYNPNYKYYEASLINSGYYTPGELFRTTTKGENYVEGEDNFTTVEYRNKQGQIILKKQYDDSTELETYYVYDIYGNLTYVLPPQVNLNDINLNGLCFQYIYDYRNRLAKKKLPGKQWEYIIYDKANRPIVSGPVYSPFGNNETGFMYYRYDIYNRVCFSGWFPQEINDNTYGFLVTTYGETIENARKTSSSTTLNNINLNYTIDNLPSSFILLSVNYYDDYAFIGASNPPSGEPIYLNANGLVTGSWVRAIKDNNSVEGETNTIFYDKKSRPIHVNSNNCLGGFTSVTTKYNFIGQPEKIVTNHKRLSGNSNLKLTENFSYDGHSKLTTSSHQIDSLNEELISHNTYDELGNLISKDVGGNDLTTYNGLQKIDYQYNIRGWLTKINDVDALIQEGQPTDLFAFKISYNNVINTLNDEIKPLYNGNISETYWRSASDNVLRKYSYKYDGINRLRKAIYQKPNNNNPLRNSYNELITYEKNGNITKLTRTGEQDDQSETLEIDLLEYFYDSDKPNQLIKVTDGSNNPNGFKDDTNTDIGDINADYSYDDNGNLKYDHNKSIENIFYNHLNLPTKIVFSDGNYIEYLYDATGKKLTKSVSSGGQVVKTDYLDGFQYKNNKLQFFPTAEGYVNCYEDESTSGRIYSYVYTYKDHLGNIRLTYGKDPATGNLRILEENHYYPFGLKHTNYNSDKMEYGKQNSVYLLKEIPSTKQSIYNYKYNEKEWQDELGLNVYDYGARNYDPSIGRWMNLDPLAEISASESPFSYAYNNPMFYIDSDGQIPTPFEAAVMAADVYNPRGRTLPGGWKLSTVIRYNVDDKRIGMTATMYERTKNGKKEYAYVYAGTDDLQDIIEDVLQPFGASRQYFQAKSKAQRINQDFGSSEVTFVGHSLGGGLANYSSLFTGRSSMTFNPAWLSEKIVGRFKNEIKSLKAGNNRRNFVHESDPLNDIQQLLGDEVGLEETGEHIEVDGGWDSNIFTGHLIDEMIDSMIDNHDSDGYERSDDGWYEVSQSSRYF